MRALLTVFCLICLPQIMSAESIRQFPLRSEVLGRERVIRVRLPASYHQSPERRYPVLYVHDGQNVFSTAGTNSCFGWGSWNLDVTAAKLEVAGKMAEIIMVSVENSRYRYTEYRGPAYPYNASELAARATRPSAPGDNRRYEKYRSFLIDELKPRIDREYRTLPGSQTTGVMGSSMGGICSLALAWDRPDVFGLVASLSGSFQVERGYFLKGVIQKHAEGIKPLRIYLDSGVVDSSGGDDGCRLSGQVASALHSLGWTPGKDLEHYVDEGPMDEAKLEETGLRRDKWAEARISQHNEFYWRERAWRPLVFLFPPAR